MPEKPIQVPFIAVDMMRHDQLIRVGYALLHGRRTTSPSPQVPFWNNDGPPSSAPQRPRDRRRDIKGDIDLRELSHDLGQRDGHPRNRRSIHGNIVTRLAQVWRIILAGTVTPASLPYFTQFLTRSGEPVHMPNSLDAGHEPSPSGSPPWGVG